MVFDNELVSIVAQFLFTVIFSVCRFIEPTILLDPPLDADIMTEEIFGPLLPIITVRNLQLTILSLL